MARLLILAASPFGVAVVSNAEPATPTRPDEDRPLPPAKIVPSVGTTDTAVAAAASLVVDAAVAAGASPLEVGGKKEVLESRASDASEASSNGAQATELLGRGRGAVRTSTSYYHPQAYYSRSGATGSRAYGSSGNYGRGPYNPVDQTQSADSSGAGSIFGHMVVGFFLFVFAFPLLFANEKRQAAMWSLFERAKTILQKNVTGLMDGSLVHMVGETSVAQPDGNLRDKEFGVEVSNCASLTRCVEMLQWVVIEEQQQQQGQGEMGMGGGGIMRQQDGQQGIIGTQMQQQPAVVVKRELRWLSYEADEDADMAFRTPASRPWPAELKGQNATLCKKADKVDFHATPASANPGFLVPRGLVSQMRNSKSVDPRTRAATSVTIGGRLFTARDDKYFLSGNGEDVGDMRVSFTKVECGPCSLIAVQSGATFAPLLPQFQLVEGGNGKKVDLSRPPYAGGGSAADVALRAGLLAGGSDAETQGAAELQVQPAVVKSAGCCGLLASGCGFVSDLVEKSGACLFELAEQAKSAEQMMNDAGATQNSIHSVLQIVGFFMLFFGFRAMLEVFPALLNLVPLVGGFLHLVAGFLVTFVSFFVAAVCWVVTVGVAWFYVHPKYAAGLFGGLVVAIVLLNGLGMALGGGGPSPQLLVEL